LEQEFPRPFAISFRESKKYIIYQLVTVISATQANNLRRDPSRRAANDGIALPPSAGTECSKL
jgi:hypothetical protein